MDKFKTLGRNLFKNSSTLETEEERKARWKSIFVIYATIFLMSFGVNITLTNMWRYLDKVDPNASVDFINYIIAASPLAQMIASPLFGYWSNRIRSNRVPLITTMIIFAFGSIMYATITIFPTDRKYWMIISRLFIGVSSANIALCRSYLSAASTIDERTTAVSMGSLSQVLGFVAGPLLQAFVTPLGNEGIQFLNGRLELDMYTVTGWINAVIAVINIVILLPFCFQEKSIAAKEAMAIQGESSEKDAINAYKIDLISAWTLIIAFFVIVLNFVILESLGTPLIMDQFALTKKEALFYISILMSVGALISCISYVVLGPLCKRFDERKILIWGGFFLMVLGRFVYFPWSDELPKIKYTNVTIDDLGKEIEEVGCPYTQDWCRTTNRLTITQFLLGYVLTAIAYPIGATLIQTILSKVLGPHPQGVWMGLFTGSGSFSRVVGPILLTSMYTKLGIIWTFGSLGAIMALTVVWLLLVKHKLVPATTEKSLDKSLDQPSKQTKLKQGFIESLCSCAIFRVEI